MSITKCRDFCKRMIPKNLVLVSTESISDLPIFKLGDTEAVLEPKLVNSVRPSHSSVAPRLLGFHRVPKSVTPISNSRSDRVSLVQWHKPNRWDRVFQLGGSEMVSAET